MDRLMLLCSSSQAAPQPLPPVITTPSSAAPQTGEGLNTLFTDMPIWGYVLIGFVAALLTVLLLLLLSRFLQQRHRANKTVSIGNLHNIGNRTSQQDYFVISDLSNQEQYNQHGLLTVVADGMGGLEGGAEISAMTATYLLQNYYKLSPELDIASRLFCLVNNAQTEVRRYLDSNGSGMSGTTVVVAVVHNHQLFFSSVGDSRICLVRNGKLTQLNREHNYAADLDEMAARGEISLEQAQTDPQRKSLTSYIGINERLQVDRNISPIALEQNDRLLLMTDGVFGALDDNEILQALADPNVQCAAEKLEQMVLSKSKPSQDNFTAVIIGGV